MKVLVTGASGFVGRHLIAELESHGNSVTATSLLDDSAASSGSKFVQLDVTDYEQCIEVLDQTRPEGIVHLAAIAFVPAAEKNFLTTLNVNVVGISNLLRSITELKLDNRLIFVSSSEVYGKARPEDIPFSESSPHRPANNYGLSKLMAEEVVGRYRREGLNTCIVRPFNHIGPGQSPDFVVSNFARQLAEIKKGGNEALIRVGNLEAKRDFSDVRDIVRGYRELLSSNLQGPLNLCSGRAVSIQDILDKLIEISGLKVEVQQDPERMRPSEVPVLEGSYDNALAEFGWKPGFSLEDSLKAVYEYWLKSDE